MLRGVLETFGDVTGNARTLTGVRAVRDHRLELAGIQMNLAVESSIRVARQRFPVRDGSSPVLTFGGVRASLHKVEGRLVWRDHARPRARLDTHVADRHALRHAQRFNRLASVLEDIARAAVRADLRDDREDDVFGGHAATEFAADVDRHCFGLGLQQALRREHVTDFGRANPERQRPERAVRAGVAVAADNRHAGMRNAHFWPDDVNHALHLAVDVPQRHAEIGAVFAKRLHLIGLLRAPHLERDHVGGVRHARRDAVIHRREGFLRLAHL